MPQLDYLTLKQLLITKYPSIVLQPETNQLYTAIRLEGKEYPFFARIFDGGVLLQLIAFIPCTWTTYHTPEVAQLLHLLNKELELPGFGLDDTMRLPFFRHMLFAKDGVIDPDLLMAVIDAIEVACSTFTPVITQVAEGKLKYREVVKLAREQGLLSTPPASTAGGKE
jgi:hypothetical protein